VSRFFLRIVKLNGGNKYCVPRLCNFCEEGGTTTAEARESMITLNLSDIRFMLKTLALSDSHRALLNKLISQSNKSISDNIADDLRELCTDRLDTHGFDANYNPTKEGEKLEELIDKLYTG
jgi:hypothetical protein